MTQASFLEKIWTEHVETRIDEVAACLLAAAIAVVSFWRLRFGVDFTDEAFYAAITHRYALGDVPYLDEYNLRQTASLLTVPPYWLYIKIRGNTDGVVYFLRILYFLIQLGTGWTVFRFAEKRVPRSFAIIAASLSLVFIPFQIPTCSYNNLGAMLFAAGAFTTLRGLLDEPRPSVFMTGGVLHGLACVAYPPMGIPVALFALTTHLARPKPEGQETRRQRWAPLLRYMVGLCGVGLLLGVLLLPGLLHHGVSQALNYEHMTTMVRNSDKARDVLKAVQATVPGGPGWLATLGVLGLVVKQYEKLRPYVLAALVLWFAYYFWDKPPGVVPSLNSIYVTIYFGLLAGFFILLIQPSTLSRTLALAMWAPSVLAGFISGFATANGGCMNSAIGLFAAASLAMVVAPMSAKVDTLPVVARVAGVLVMSTIPFTMLSVNCTTTYRSGEIASLTAKVRSGPYRGIWSAPDRVRQAEQLDRDVRETIGAAPRMLAYYDIPAPYLSALARPAIPTVWTDSRARLSLLLPYYQQHRTGEGIVVTISGMPNHCPEMEAIAADPKRLLKDGGWYKIYREPPP
jgi:hypothetical protein